MKAFIKDKLSLALTGALAGMANGFFGGGGGMIAVPLMIFLLRRPQKNAHATALLVILPLSIVSGLIYAGYGNFNFQVGIPATIGVVVGGIIGALLLKKINNGLLTKLFAVVMLVAGARLLF